MNSLVMEGKICMNTCQDSCTGLTISMRQKLTDFQFASLFCCKFNQISWGARLAR